MKKQLVSKLCGLATALSILLLAGCSKEDNGPHNEEPFWLEANLLMDNNLFLNSLEGRNSDKAFEVLEIVREDDVLKVTVKGADEDGSFQFIWDGRLQESYPMGVRLIMVYHGTDKGFDPEKEMTVSVNLQKIIGERNNLKDYHFFVVNGSQRQSVTLNPDGTNSSEGQ